MDTPQVAILIPVYNDAATIAACVRAVIRRTRLKCVSITVIDDGSTDDTPGILRQLEGIKVIRKPRGGVATALNAGIAANPGADIVRLHADVVVETDDWLERMIAAACTDERAAVVGARIVFPDGRIDSEGRSIISGFGMHPRHRNRRAFQGEGAVGKRCEVDSVSGALAYYRRVPLDLIGGFDENYAPAWGDDDDYCIAVRQRGFKVYVEPSTTAVHYTRSCPPTFQAYVGDTSSALNKVGSYRKYAAHRIQAEYWIQKWGWHPYYPDLSEIRRLYGETEICWQIGEPLRFRNRDEFPTVDCCLVTWNTLPLLRRSLDSLRHTDYPRDRIRVYVANNGSTDGTAEYLASIVADYPFPLQVIDLATNTGVAAGLNFALLAGQGELVARLDDDIVLPANWLRVLISNFRNRPFAGCVGSKTINDNELRTVQWACPHSHPVGFNHSDEPDDGRTDYVARVSNIHGCCNLYRRDALKRCGLIDIRYSPSQYDDIDHHMALIQAGYEVLYDGRVAVIHKLNSGLDRSWAGLASGAANANKMFGKWGRDVFETLDTAILISREGRYLPDDGRVPVAELNWPAPSDFPRAAKVGPRSRRFVQAIYDDLAAIPVDDCELTRVYRTYLQHAANQIAGGCSREAADTLLTALNFFPNRVEAYRKLSELYRQLGSGLLMRRIASRGLHLFPEDDSLSASLAEDPREQRPVEFSRRPRNTAVNGGVSDMKVLFVVPFHGAGRERTEVRLQQLSQELSRLSCDVEFTAQARPDPRGFDLVHVWGAGTPNQAVTQVKAIRLLAPTLPVIVSADYTDRRDAEWLGAATSNAFSTSSSTDQLARALAAVQNGQCLVNGEPRPGHEIGEIYPRGSSLFYSALLNGADWITTSSKSEADEIVKRFGESLQCSVLPTGIDVNQLRQSGGDQFTGEYGVKDYILVVGDVQPRANQLMALMTAGSLNAPIVCLGRPLDAAYRRVCEKFASAGTLFLDEVRPELMRSCLLGAKVVMSAAYDRDVTETTVLQAAVLGVPLVLSDYGWPRECFGDAVQWFDPTNANAAAVAVQRANAGRAAAEGRRQALGRKIAAAHSWPVVAGTARRLYTRLLHDTRDVAVRPGENTEPLLA